MQLDCRGLACPEPVIKTKNALEELPNDSVLEVLVSTEASKQNVMRFAANGGYTNEAKNQDDYFIINIVKGFACGIASESSSQSQFQKRVLFLKSDKVGEGELGSKLVVGFLKSILELPKPPQKIICVNTAVYLTTADETSDVMQALQALEAKGVEIYSCGVCLDFYGVADRLKVGVVGNAYDTVDTLLSSEGTITL